MKFYFNLALCVMLLASCRSEHTIEVTNYSDFARSEIVEADMSEIENIFGKSQFRILDPEGNEIPYQVTYDKKLIFPAAVGARKSVSYSMEKGSPAQCDTIVCGALYPERMDDMTWENDRCAFRAYGPALGASGEKAYGYDIWTKSVRIPIVKRRYHDAIHKDKSLHVDHGDGMDVYSVGPTLGAGTAALVDSADNIAYPGCFSTYEILDNGPLRFTLRLGYDSGESRLISLDAGEFLNRTTVSLGDSASGTLAAGIVIHRQNPDGYALSPEDGYMAYADLTDNADNGNGVIYVGVVSPEAESMTRANLDKPQGDAIGHILSKHPYNPDSGLTYWWGAGWSKGGMPGWTEWKKYLAEFSLRLRQPLSVHVRQ